MILLLTTCTTKPLAFSPCLVSVSPVILFQWHCPAEQQLMLFPVTKRTYLFTSLVLIFSLQKCKYQDFNKKDDVIISHPVSFVPPARYISFVLKPSYGLNLHKTKEKDFQVKKTILLTV